MPKSELDTTMPKETVTAKPNRRYAVLYADGSFGVTDDGRDLLTSQKRLGYDNSDEDAKFVEVDIRVTRIIHDRNPRFQVATEHSASCPTCGTEVFMGEQDGED